MTKPVHIAIVEDDPDIADILSGLLRRHGFETESFGTAGTFFRSLARREPDLCLVDLTLPDRDGLSIVAELRSRPRVATIIVSGRHELDSKLIGLELGADDYIVKPFEEKEVLARIRSVLRRVAPEETPAGRTVARFAGWTVDFGRFEMAGPDGRTHSLSGGEAAVLRILLESPNRLLTRNDLMERLGISDRNFDRSIDVRISRIRAKLEPDPRDPRYIKTVYGAGYLLASPVEWS